MKPYSVDILMKLTEDTSSVFPAGDWVDMRQHMPLLHSIARWCNNLYVAPKQGQEGPPPLCLEIGVRQGVSSLAILGGLQFNNGRLISLDPDPVETQVAQELVTAAGLDSHWDFHLTTSQEFRSSFDQSIDFLMIDGLHHHPHPTEDFDLYAPLVRRDGIIVMHDYYLESHRADAFGVRMCVDRLHQDPNYQVLVLPWGCGLTLIRKLQ